MNSISKLSFGIYPIPKPPPLVKPLYPLPPGRCEAAAVEGFLDTKS